MPTSKTKIITQTKKRKARGNKSSQEVYRVAVTVVSDVYQYFISKKIFLILGGGGGSGNINFIPHFFPNCRNLARPRSRINTIRKITDTGHSWDFHENLKEPIDHITREDYSRSYLSSFSL